jgi:CBS domain-containing protein
MKIREILRSKGTDVVTVEPGATVHDAMRRLVEHDIGSLVVLEDADVVGIITERDVLRLGSRDPVFLKDRRVSEAMSEDVIIATPDEDIYYCMEVMTRNRVRHLPILEEGELRGMVSIGDVVNACRRDAEAENQYLKDYIRGSVR